jgi:GMP synthase-like glutamine amidotransferase
MRNHHRNRYLILDNSLNRVLLPEGMLTRQFIGAPADLLWAAGGEFPDALTPYRGVILSGSEATVPDNRRWYAAERDIIRECLEYDIPLLGICFGAQFLSAVLWGSHTVSLMAEPEIGWIRVRCDRDNPLFAGLAAEFVVWSGHYWGYQAGTHSLAHSDVWDQHAFQVPGHRAWGIQFHPEVPWWYGSFRNRWERWHNRQLVLHRAGRPAMEASRQIALNFSALAR